MYPLQNGKPNGASRGKIKPLNIPELKKKYNAC
jgi:hypothetical protein